MIRIILGSMLLSLLISTQNAWGQFPGGGIPDDLGFPEDLSGFPPEVARQIEDARRSLEESRREAEELQRQVDERAARTRAVVEERMARQQEELERRQAERAADSAASAERRNQMFNPYATPSTPTDSAPSSISPSIPLYGSGSSSPSSGSGYGGGPGSSLPPQAFGRFSDPPVSSFNDDDGGRLRSFSVGKMIRLVLFIGALFIGLATAVIGGFATLIKSFGKPSGETQYYPTNTPGSPPFPHHNNSQFTKPGGWNPSQGTGKKQGW